MKKKLVLIALPALMVLSGCSFVPKVNARADLMIEDTLAHEEIFGELPVIESEPAQLAPRKAHTPGELYEPVLYFQHKDNLDGTYSVRFIATIEDKDYEAEWSRSVHNLSGVFAPEKTLAHKTVTTVYEALNNEGNPSYAVDETEIDNDEEETKPFNYYAVYCLLNIPDTYADYYVDAYITVTNGPKEKSSAVGSLNVANPNSRIKYGLFETTKYIAEVNGEIRNSDSTSYGNCLELHSIPLLKDDTLQIDEITIDTSSLTYSRSAQYKYDKMGKSFPDFEEGTDGIISTKYRGTFNVFVNYDTKKIYFERKIWFQGPIGWGTDKGAKIQLKDGGYPEHSMSSTGTAALFFYFVDNVDHTDVQFFQQIGDTKSDWTGYRGGSIAEGKDLFTLSTWDSPGTNGSWSVYGA